MKTEAMVKAVVTALEDIKGRDIVVLDVKKVTSLFDMVVVASGESTRQNRALANSVREKLKAAGANVLSVEGVDPGEWVLVDLGAVVVHIMQPAIRQYYNLEELWNVAPAKSMTPAKKSAAKKSAPAKKRAAVKKSAVKKRTSKSKA